MRTALRDVFILEPEFIYLQFTNGLKIYIKLHKIT